MNMTANISNLNFEGPTMKSHFNEVCLPDRTAEGSRTTSVGELVIPIPQRKTTKITLKGMVHQPIFIPKEKNQKVLLVTYHNEMFRCLLAESTSNSSIMEIKILNFNVNRMATKIDTELALNEPLDTYLFIPHESKNSFIIASSKGKIVHLNAFGVALKYQAFSTCKVAQMKLEGNFLLSTGEDRTILSIYDTLREMTIANITMNSKMVDFTCVSSLPRHNTDEQLFAAILNEAGELLVFQVSRLGINLLIKTTPHLPTSARFAPNNFELNAVCIKNELRRTKIPGDSSAFYLQIETEGGNKMLHFTKKTSKYTLKCLDLKDEQGRPERLVPLVLDKNEIVSCKEKEVFGISLQSAERSRLVYGEYSDVQFNENLVLLTELHTNNNFILLPSLPGFRQN